MFENRQEAGKKLASELLKYRKENPYVLAIPRGGVPIGYEIAQVLQAPFDVIVVRKIGLSGNPEFGIGAIAEGGVKELDATTIEALGIDEMEIKNAIELEEKELERRVNIYRGDKHLPDLTGRVVILVDDGMATGVSARAAIKAVGKFHPKKIIFATPVCHKDTAESLRSKTVNVFCLAEPLEFMSVGAWYRNFEQVSDEEIINLLKQTRK